MINSNASHAKKKKKKAGRLHSGSTFQEMRGREQSQPRRKQALRKESGSRV